MSTRRAIRFAWAPRPLRHTLNALRLLHPHAQLQLIEFWRAPAYFSRGEPTPNAYQRRDDIYAIEKAIHQKDTSDLTDYGPLLPLLAKWGLYQVLYTNITQIANDTRELENQKDEREAQKRRIRAAQEADRQAAQAATQQKITELLGPEHHKTTFIHFPDGHLQPNLNTVIYLPEAPEHEPDPDRPGILVKSPALALHINTQRFPTLEAYMSGTDDQLYHGISIERRLRSTHPELFPQETTA